MVFHMIQGSWLYVGHLHTRHTLPPTPTMQPEPPCAAVTWIYAHIDKSALVRDKLEQLCTTLFWVKSANEKDRHPDEKNVYRVI